MSMSADVARKIIKVLTTPFPGKVKSKRPRWLSHIPPASEDIDVSVIECEETDTPTFEIVYPYRCWVVETSEPIERWGPEEHQVWYPCRTHRWNLTNILKGYVGGTRR